VDAEIRTLPEFPVPGLVKLAVTPVGRESGIESETSPVKPIWREIDTSMSSWLPGFIVTEPVLSVILLRPGCVVDIFKFASREATPVALALTRTVTLVVWTLVAALILTLPVLPVPGFVNVADTPAGKDSGMDSETEPVKPDAREMDTLTSRCPPGVTETELGLNEILLIPGGWAVVMLRLASREATPEALARTRTATVVSCALVDADIRTLPELPAPGLVKLAVTPGGRESGIDNVTDPVNPD